MPVKNQQLKLAHDSFDHILRTQYNKLGLGALDSEGKKYAEDLTKKLHEVSNRGRGGTVLDNEYNKIIKEKEKLYEKLAILHSRGNTVAEFMDEMEKVDNMLRAEKKKAKAMKGDFWTLRKDSTAKSTTNKKLKKCPRGKRRSKRSQRCVSIKK